MGQIVKVAFNSHDIRTEDEFFCLTDMWRAAGADPSKQPGNWKDSKQATEFADFLRENVIPGNSGYELFRSERGGREPRTWAHWQLAYAYAKYLSPPLHAWMNDIVKAYREGRLTTADDSWKQALVQIGQGVESLLVGQQEHRQDIAQLRDSHGKLERRVEDIAGQLPRKDFGAKDEREFRSVVLTDYQRRCPCCSRREIVNWAGDRAPKADVAPSHVDHWSGVRSDNRRSNGWLICVDCHKGKDPTRHELYFKTFQARLSERFPIKRTTSTGTQLVLKIS